MRRPDFCRFSYCRCSSVISPKHINIAEHARWRGMADADDLVRFALATVWRTQHLGGTGVAHRPQAFPELRGNAPVVGVFHHALELAVFDQLAPLATRSEEHTSELQSLMRILSAVFC